MPPVFSRPPLNISARRSQVVASCSRIDSRIYVTRSSCGEIDLTTLMEPLQNPSRNDLGRESSPSTQVRNVSSEGPLPSHARSQRSFPTT